MACSLPVIGSPIGVNSEIIEHKKNRFLASTPEEWEKHLKELISNPDIRKTYGISGRNRV